MFKHLSVINLRFRLILSYTKAINAFNLSNYS